MTNEYDDYKSWLASDGCMFDGGDQKVAVAYHAGYVDGKRAAQQVAEADRAGLTNEVLTEFANENGGREVHRSWRDTMLEQGRHVRPELMEWDALSAEDRTLDCAISAAVLIDFRAWLLGGHLGPEA
jgi:hypothetical protein